jgi:D-inositol-3-phosphate glycosyltransferase
VNEQKGTDLLLGSWPAVRVRVPDATLVIAGPIGQFGDAGRVRDDGSWRKRIARVGGFYLGAVDESRLAAVYNMADVFVMPTRRSEMFGMAAVEAQACGTPVIASDHGGLRETVPRRCGGRFPSGDATALSRQLERLLTDTAQRAACAEASIVNARRFSWDRITQGLERSYVKAGIYG